jgi:hypothetical protein
LQPGESARVPVYYAAWQQPWDFSYPPITFHLGVLNTDDTAPIDWNSMQEMLRSPGVNADAWNAIYGNVVAETGSTWGAYVQRLDATASFLGHLGENVVDIGQLWIYWLNQANWLNPVNQLVGGACGISGRHSLANVIGEEVSEKLDFTPSRTYAAQRTWHGPRNLPFHTPTAFSICP